MTLTMILLILIVLGVGNFGWGGAYRQESYSIVTLLVVTLIMLRLLGWV
ncbi:DUF3309 domain-containing protein [Methylobacterium segetis]|nr:DUF3309 domain-containing protein [Methylobacterium segetis]